MSGREQIVTNSEKSNLSTDPDHVNRQADTLKFDAIRAMNMGLNGRGVMQNLMNSHQFT